MTDATTDFVWDAGAPLNVFDPEVTMFALSVYVPGMRLFHVVVAVATWLKPPGPVTVTLPFTPAGSPDTVSARLPVEIA